MLFQQLFLSTNKIYFKLSFFEVTHFGLVFLFPLTLCLSMGVFRSFMIKVIIDIIGLIFIIFVTIFCCPFLSFLFWSLTLFSAFRSFI